MKRAFLNVFLFLFAPVTRQSIECCSAVNRATTTRSPGTMTWDTVSTRAQIVDPPVLVFDAAVTCYEGEHLLLMIMSITVLVVMVLALPAILLFVVRRTRVMRAASWASGQRGGPLVDCW